MFKSKKIIASLSITSMLVLSTAPAIASDDSSHHEIKKNIIGVFGGFTNVDGHTNGTFGIEYERRFTRQLGVGFIYEHTPNAHHGDGTSIYMGELHLHPWKELRLSVGFGIEDVHHEGAHNEDVWRVGAVYDFHIGEIGLAPTINFDRIDGHTATVFGLTLIKGF